MAAKKTDDKGKKVKFIRKNGKVIPIRDKGGASAGKKEYNSLNRKDKSLSKSMASTNAYMFGDTHKKVRKFTPGGMGVGAAIGAIVGGVVGGRKGALVGGSILGLIGASGKKNVITKKGQRLQSNMVRDYKSAQKYGNTQDDFGDSQNQKRSRRIFGNEGTGF